MRRVIALLALAGAVALVVAGCGGGGSKPLSKAEYEQQMTAIGQSLTNSLNSLSTSTSATNAATALKQLQTDLAKAAGEMNAITPPDNVKTEHENLATSLQEFSDELDPIITKLEGGDMTAVAGVTALPALAKIQTASTAINDKGYSIGSG
jgi:ABC-type glycerol-3-phosphate transport system substrate-binding protein